MGRVSRDRLELQAESPAQPSPGLQNTSFLVLGIRGGDRTKMRILSPSCLETEGWLAPMLGHTRADGCEAPSF